MQPACAEAGWSVSLSGQAARLGRSTWVYALRSTGHLGVSQRVADQAQSAVDPTPSSTATRIVPSQFPTRQ